MPVWLDEPQRMIIVSPDTVLNNNTFRVRVTDLSNNALDSSLVCLTKKDENSDGVVILEKSYTDYMSDAVFNLDYQNPCSILVTATLNGYIPIQKNIILTTDGPYLSYVDKNIVEKTGNDDGIINPGEEIDIEILMQNIGNEIIDSLELILRSKNSYIEILDSLFKYPLALYPDSNFLCNFYFVIDSNLKTQSPINFELIGTSTLNSWKNIFSDIIGIPNLKIASSGKTIYGTDSIPNGGDSLLYYYSLKNYGHGNGYNVELMFRTIDSNIILRDSVLFIDTLESGSEIEGSLFTYISPHVIEPYLGFIHYDIRTLENYTFNGSLSIKIGETGFYDNLESGTSNWEHYGIKDLWHLSNYRSYSGDNSFYCGYNASHLYSNGMQAVLKSRPFTVFSPCSLSFYHWYEYPNYGNDGLLVIVEHGSKMDTLDFIGSGGALDSILNIGNPWLEDKYDLSYINNQDSIRIHFVFISDNEDVAEGIYIDDIQVTGRITTLSGTKEKEIDVLRASSNLLYKSGLAFITLDESRKISLKLYDKTGRLIKTIIQNELYQKGSHPIKINVNIPSGIYFLNLSGTNLQKTEKIVIIR
jgi:hypothetical protein